MKLSVAEAADRLGVSRERVRALARSGRLAARRIGRTWIVDESALHPPARIAVGSGRPLSARSAWAVLRVLNGEEPPGISRTERQRAHDRAGRIGQAPPGWLAARALVHPLVVHRGLVDKLAADDRLLASGASAALASGADLIALGQVEAYVRLNDLAGLINDYILGPPVENVAANVVLRVPMPTWPFVDDATIAPPPVVAVDLIDAGDFRSVRAGRALLAGR